MYFDRKYSWDKLLEIKGMSYNEVIEWLKSLGFDKFDEENHEIIWIDGYYADESPIIEFEDGKVARWYRGGCWD